MKKVAGPLRLNLAQFRELEAFAEFGSELDAASLAQLERGRRVVEVLKQPQFDPVPVEQQAVVIYAVTTGAMDDIDVDKIGEAESAMREYFVSRANHVLEEIASTGGLPDGDTLDNAIAAFKETLEG